MSRSWTEEQSELFLQNASGLFQYPRVAVEADAGSGKTSVLVERVRKIYESELGTTKRVLCVSFTEKSAADIKDRLSGYLFCEVYTIHGYCAKILQEFSSKLELPPLWRIITQEESSDFFLKSFDKIYRIHPPQKFEHSLDVLRQVSRIFIESQKDSKEYLSYQYQEELIQFLQSVQNEFMNQKRIARGLDYSDLERFALSALSDHSIQSVLQNRYAHIFIDEFQDTSELQCTLVQRLIGKNTEVFVVGDVKQSIYRFRGANVEVFKEFVKKFPAQKYLTTNFRSHPNVIETINEVCAPILPNYRLMTAGRVANKIKIQPKRVKAATQEQAILSILKDLNHQGVDLSQVVLLLPRIRGNKALFKVLEESGVPVTVVAGQGVLQSSFFKLINLWIWACEPWQKLRAAQVAIDFSNDFNIDLNEAIIQLQKRAYEQLKFINKFSCTEFLNYLNASYDLENKFGIYYNQFKLFILKYQNKGCLPLELARRFSRLSKDEKSIDGLSHVPPPPELQGSLRVFSVHSSKGLEFPYVILADLQGKKSQQRGAVLNAPDKLFIASRGEDGKLHKSESFLEALEQEKEMETAESARLLYVAMTRAQEGLFFAESSEEKKLEAWQKWIDDSVNEVEVVEDPCALSVCFNKNQNPLKVKMFSPIEKSNAIYSQARIGVTQFVQDNYVYPERSSNSYSKIYNLTAEEIRNLGTELHACLEHEDWEQFNNIADQRKLDFLLFEQWRSTEQGRLMLSQHSRLKRSINEFAFEWKTQNGVFTGRIDRLNIFCEPEEAWIIDYKFLNTKRLSSEFIHEYQAQMKIYAQAVKSLTKFSVVRAFLLDLFCATGSVCHEIDCSVDIL